MKILNLLEKTYNISSDVNVIYDKYFKTILDDILNNTWNGILNNSNSEFSSELLTSSYAKIAHKSNPVIIRVLNGKGNNYAPSTSIINLNFGVNAIRLLQNYNNNIDDAMYNLPDVQKTQFKNEFNESKIKGSISHELSHWIDDSINNGHIASYITKR